MNIDIATVFSRAPWGRFPSDGPNNGERFRKEFLVPALRTDNDKIEILLGGCEGFGSSFLEEAFGGLVRREGFTAPVLARRLIIVPGPKSHELFVRLIRNYIEKAKPE